MDIAKSASTYDNWLLEIFPSASQNHWPNALALVHKVEHLRWMLHEVQEFIQRDNHSKAVRWLGFVEGSMVQLGLVPLAKIQFYDVQSAIENS